MGKTVKTARPRWLSGRRLFFINAILAVTAIALIAYRPFLRLSASILIYSDPPAASDAIVVLAGGEPGRAWEAADLYREKYAPVVAVTFDLPSSDEIELRRHGIELGTGSENYVRVLRGLGVPDGQIRRVEPAVEDTFDELIRVREFASRQEWKSLILVTSNYHSRRTKLTAGYLFPKTFQYRVVASRHGGLDRQNWWTKTSHIRIFVIEFEKLIAYSFYIWPRKVLRWR